MNCTYNCDVIGLQQTDEEFWLHSDIVAIYNIHNIIHNSSVYGDARDAVKIIELLSHI